MCKKKKKYFLLSKLVFNNPSPHSKGHGFDSQGSVCVHVLPAWVPFRYTGCWLEWVAVLCLCGPVMNWWLVCGVTPPLPHDPEWRRRNERKWMEKKKWSTYLQSGMPCLLEELNAWLCCLVAKNLVLASGMQMINWFVLTGSWLTVESPVAPVFTWKSRKKRP